MKVLVRAVDDALLDGDVTVELTASASNVDSDTINIIVKDHETLDATFASNPVAEDGSTTVRIQRSNTNVDEALAFNLGGQVAAELEIVGERVIPAGQQVVTLKVQPVNDEDPEPTLDFNFTFSASNYATTTTEFKLTDDEPPLFQNPKNEFDVDASGFVASSDALAIINELQFRVNNAKLDPETEQPKPNLFLDANGDYLVTALDALVVINALSLQGGETEQIATAESEQANWVSEVGATTTSDDEEENLRSLFDFDRTITIGVF